MSFVRTHNTLLCEVYELCSRLYSYIISLQIDIVTQHQKNLFLVRPTKMVSVRLCVKKCAFFPRECDDKEMISHSD